MQEAPFIAIARHRMGVDGEGITTLVAFHGCPLRCKYCLNEPCLCPDGVWRRITTEQLLKEVAIDHLYFLATGGGICFGGGEPCLRSLFIEEFYHMMDSRWRITVETSLNVPREHVERLLPYVSQWVVDVKDMDPEVYKEYTGRSNRRSIANLRWLLAQEGMAEKVILRLPLIPEFNTPDHVRRSRALLEEMGARHFDEFKYIINMG